MAWVDAHILDLAVFTLVVVCVFALTFGVRGLFAARVDPLARRIQASVVPRSASMPAPALSNIDPGPRKASMLESALKPVVSVAKPTDEAELQGLRSRLSYAGYRGERAMLYFLSAKVFFCVALAAAYLFYDASRAEPDSESALYTIVAMIVGFYAPSMWLDGRGKERQKELERALPDALDVLVTCVEAGLGLDAALNRIASESGMAGNLLQAELLQTSYEMRAGLGRGDAMRRLANRTGVAELKFLASVIVQTEVFGTSVSKSLRVMSDSMRIRRTQRAEERAATVAVKMTLPLVLCILPALFAVLLGPAMINISTTLLPQLGAEAKEPGYPMKIQRLCHAALLGVSLTVATACAGANSELSDETTLTDEKANPYAFNRSVALTLLRTQQPAEALRVVRRMIDLDSESAEPYYIAGRAHVDLRQFKLAERSLREALKRKPEYAEAHSMYGVLLDMLERHEEARWSHQRALKYAPDKAEFHNNLGFHYFLCKQYDKAAKAYEVALEHDPSSRRTHNNLGFAYGKLGRIELALRHFQYAGPPAQATNNLGVVFEERGELAKAFDAFVAACRIDPRLVPSRANLARVGERLGRELPELPTPHEPQRAPEDPTAAAAVSMSAPTEPASAEVEQ